MRSAVDPPMRLGVVGCGYIAERAHLPVLKRLREVEVVAIADRDAERLRRVGDAFAVSSRHPNAEQLIADPAVEAVGVLVPPAEHAGPALAALAAGKHVLVEKPLTLSLAEADALIERAAASAGVATVGFNMRRLDAVRRARELVQGGELGEVQALHGALTSRRGLDAEVPAWRRRRELGGGSLVEQGIHHFDLWRFLLGTEVDTVFAVARPEDSVAAVTARMADGVLVQTTLSERSSATHRIEIFGSRASVRLRPMHFDGLQVLPLALEDWAPAARARRLTGTLLGLPRAVERLRAGGHFASCFEEQWRAFAAAVRGGEAIAPTFEDGRRALEISLAAVRSASTGDAVRLHAARHT